ncbi:MAG: hypothetical protein ACRD1C_09865 [Terriglobales bacterium]
MTPARWRQLAVVFRLELVRTFSLRRSWWIYLLALAPLGLVAIYGAQVHNLAAQRAAWMAQGQRPLTDADFEALQKGMTTAQVEHLLGSPSDRSERKVERRGRLVHRFVYFRYATQDATHYLVLRDGNLSSWERRSAPTFADSSRVFASIYQFFTLRLVVFFACLGLFLRLFRGEMLDRSLHYYLLAPLRREIVLAGKFLAGLVAAIVILGGSVTLQIYFLGLQLDPMARAQFLTVQHGWAQLGAYIGVTALACLGYGAFFLVVGMFVRNPIIPAAVLLVWEAINPFLPSLLRHISIIFYLTGLLPVRLASAPGTSALFALLATSGNVLAAGWDVLGVVVATTLLLWLAAWRVRRLEIDYASE